MSKKIKILTMGDHPLSPSGVGTQTRYICEALLASGKFNIFSLGGAIKHHDYRMATVGDHGTDWRVLPIDGYGTPEIIRSILRNEKPDIVWIMTDPRFYEWLWSIDNEIRSICPIVYYHVWDNYPYPMFNRGFYESNDHIVTISKLTDDIVKNVAPDVPSTYIPHAVDPAHFKLVTDEQRKKLRADNLNPADVNKFIIFWNNRNARRKQSGTLLWWYKNWIEDRGLQEKVQLIMHTDPKDVHGQDLVHIANRIELIANRQVLFSTEKVAIDLMGAFYNMADVTINISDAEGFGLSTLESLYCGTPIIVNMTGGLQEQIIGDGGPFGVPLFPSSKSIIGSQQVPYIYEDRVSESHFKSALSNMYDMGHEERRKLGAAGRVHAITNYGFDDFKQKWINIITKVHEEHGSWDSRKNYTSINFKEIK